MSVVPVRDMIRRQPVDGRWFFLLAVLLLLPLVAAWPAAYRAMGLALGTFVSEDATCILAGVLVSAGQLDWLSAVLGCGVGILVSDLLLWAIGAGLARGVLRWPAIELLLRSAAVWHRQQDWVKQRGGAAILLARCIPGSRLPIYLSAGFLQMPFSQMLRWTIVGTLLWTPLLIGLVVLLNSSLAGMLAHWFGSTWLALVVLATSCYVSVRLVSLVAQPLGIYQLQATIARLWRWEFWPAWLFYLPLVPWLGWLSLRYRSFTVWTAANPGIPLGGVVGESKSTILAQLPTEWIIPTRIIRSGEQDARWQCAQQLLDETGWSFPLIAKPDAGQRGEGLKRLRNEEELDRYLTEHPGHCMLQPYHPGPFEAGLFYYRHLNEERGHLFSITDKQFPGIVGDGRSTLRALIWKHPRYRMQASRFLERHAEMADEVIAKGRLFPLAVAGNHCQGTLFLDGAHLITPALEARIDAIARHFPGFYIGRFDVRYTSLEGFLEGRDLAIIELNGVTSESTNIYGPRRSLWQAYHTLAHQWSLLYAIGHANRLHGARLPGVVELLREVRAYYRKTTNTAMGD
jgi:membrane protein DedA with SNARE-associated domain